MNHQQEKAFNYIYSVADGYKRTLPLLNNNIPPKIEYYSKFYKDIRNQNWDGWVEIDKLVALFPNEVAALGKTWDFRDIKNLVFTEYKKTWTENNIDNYDSTFNIDIQMFDAYLLSPNCFTTVRNAITGFSNDLQKTNNMVKSAKIAYIRRITLPEWNVQDTISKTTIKERWYDRIKLIEQL